MFPFIRCQCFDKRRCVYLVEKIRRFIKIRVLFWPEISALGVFFNFDNERMRPPKYPSAPPPPGDFLKPNRQDVPYIEMSKFHTLPFKQKVKNTYPSWLHMHLKFMSRYFLDIRWCRCERQSFFLFFPLFFWETIENKNPPFSTDSRNVGDKIF